MERQTVSSSNIRSIGYDPGAHVLEIEFHGGAVYQYFEVPESIYQGLINAQSHGSFLHAHIRDKYRYQRMS